MTPTGTLYNEVLQYTFNRRTGISIIRLPLGSSDFSLSTYVYTQGLQPSTVVSKFRFDPPDYVVTILADIFALNPDIKLILSPWSPPASLKTSDALSSGYLVNATIDVAIEYYARSIQAFASAGFPIWAFTTQNEPNNGQAYPSMLMSPTQQNQIAASLRGRLGQMGLGTVLLFSHDDNYSSADEAYESVAVNSSAVDGMAFHCYKGSSDSIGEMSLNLTQSGISDKSLHMTECSGTDSNVTSTTEERWEGMLWWLTQVFFPLPDLNVQSITVWNLALDPDSGPRLPTAVCQACTSSFTISSTQQRSILDQQVTVNLQSYVLQHFSSAIADLSWLGGSQSRRVDTTKPAVTYLSSNQMACLEVQAYASSWPTNDSDRSRLSLIVLNFCNDTLSVRVAADGIGSQVTVGAGLSTYVWNA